MKTLTMLTLRPAAGRTQEVLAYYREQGVLEASGALTAQVLVDGDDPDTVVVTALWADRSAYTAWQNSPKRREFSAGMAAFFDSAHGAHTREFQVAHESSPPA
ncbi:antibiotic biosynthesis monooxygenase family protein [Amycolatopsis circi]|uniref:antibiotic biosynthesis monooxygenase family protein n=1 Tax=Amycolatopsis circi TaxID=871959 RepID=UPI000E266177|nr:antibiotic biosynthesis monooxygenase family protein [Amycolatopsis circi]